MILLARYYCGANFTSPALFSAVTGSAIARASPATDSDAQVPAATATAGVRAAIAGCAVSGAGITGLCSYPHVRLSVYLCRKS